MMLFLKFITCYTRCFFFQAEDGIRDWSVTGVQTCALPISRHLRTGLIDDSFVAEPFAGSQHARGGQATGVKVRTDFATGLFRAGLDQLHRAAEIFGTRSEERRVGKECRYWV